MLMSSLYWDVTQLRLVDVYRRFGTSCRIQFTGRADQEECR